MTDAIRKILWGVVLLSIGVAWLGCWCIGISIGLIPYHLVILLLSFLGLSRLRKPWWSDLLVRSFYGIELVLALSLVGIAGAIISYVVFASTTGYVDDNLAQFDAALGFDWLSVWHGANKYPWIRPVAQASYNVFFVMPLIIIPGLLLTGRTSQAYGFVVAYVVGVLLTDVIFAAFPAQAAFQHFLPGQPELWGDSPRKYLADLDHLRSGTLRHIDIGKLSGIVTFPSFHASAAVLFVWASWPLKSIRAIMLITNAAMMTSITFVGGHYIVDLFGGAVVACLSVAVVKAIESQLRRMVRYLPTTLSQIDET